MSWCSTIFGRVRRSVRCARFVRGSVTDTRLVAELFAGTRFDYVYHLAAYAAEGLSHFIRRFNYTNNLIGTVNLVNEAVRAETKCFVFTSSIAVYGKAQLPMSEDMTMPQDPYGISKYAAELDLRAAHEQFGMRYVVFRPHNVYGEHQNFADPYRNVLGIFMTQLRRGHALTIFGDGEQTRAFTYIDDVAPHIARSVENRSAWNEVFNIGANRPYTVNALARMVADAFGAELRTEHLPARNEVTHAFASHEKAANALALGPEVELQGGRSAYGALDPGYGSEGQQTFR